jgi:hypothetical protein
MLSSITVVNLSRRDLWLSLDGCTWMIKKSSKLSLNASNTWYKALSSMECSSLKRRPFALIVIFGLYLDEHFASEGEGDVEGKD